MSDNARSEYIEWLMMWTGWKKEAFDNKSNHELLVMVERYREIM